MIIPGAERAIVDQAKLRDYCWNPLHPRGRHKARLFLGRSGIDGARTEELRSALPNAVRTREATPDQGDCFGQRFAVQFTMAGLQASVQARSAWIIRVGEDFPRLTSCFVVP